jgi:hypothetical protein
VLLAAFKFTRRFGRLVESALLVVLLQGHNVLDAMRGARSD